MKILIDNGHGQTTPGKRSPDGQFLEYKFNREIARRVVADLRDRGYDASLLVPEDEDVSLQERCRRANTVTVFHGKDTVAVLKGLLGSICSMASAQPPPSSRLILKRNGRLQPLLSPLRSDINVSRLPSFYAPSPCQGRMELPEPSGFPAAWQNEPLWK